MICLSPTWTEAKRGDWDCTWMCNTLCLLPDWQYYSTPRLRLAPEICHSWSQSLSLYYISGSGFIGVTSLCQHYHYSTHIWNKNNKMSTAIRWLLQNTKLFTSASLSGFFLIIRLLVCICGGFCKRSQAYHFTGKSFVSKNSLKVQFW